MEKEHLDYIDIAKGIAIIAVVIGHSFPENLYAGADLVAKQFVRLIYDFCYTWHMPAFFFISGYLFFNTWKFHEVKKLFLKAKRLLLPYFTFSIMYIPLRILMPHMANSSYSGFWKILIGVSPNGGVWYLYLLFLFMAFSLVIIKNEAVLTLFCAVGGYPKYSNKPWPYNKL